MNVAVGDCFVSQIIVDLAISAERYMSYYTGQIKSVVAQSIDGRTVRFPANILQHVVGHEGVYGRFIIEFDDHGKFVAINKISE